MIVVTGATGNVGRELVAALAAAGERVTAVSRTPREEAGPGLITWRRADLEEPETLESMVSGAESLFLLATAAEPGDILRVASAGGVRRIVLLSSQAAGTRPDAPASAHFRTFEEAARSSGMRWTILRPGGFDSNALWWRESIRRNRTAAAPSADVGLPLVDPADIAGVAAAALRDGAHDGRTYHLTGPVPVSPREQATAIEHALGVPIRFLEQTRERAREEMLRFMPPAIVEGTLAILGTPSAAEVRVSPDVERVLGRPAHPFAEWARRNAPVFM